MAILKPIISHIEWISEDAQEAILTIMDGAISLHAFCDPCRIREGAQLVDHLLAFDVDNVMRASEDSPQARLIRPPFGHECCGAVESAADRLIRIGDIRLVLDVPLPGDIGNGEFICFICARIDFLG